MRSLVAIALMTTLIGPTMAQGDLSILLSGKENPHSLKLKELNSDWKRMSIGIEGAKGGASNPLSQLLQMAMAASQKGGKHDDAASTALGMQMLSGMFGGGGNSDDVTFYTKGASIGIGGQTFLVAYRLTKPQKNFAELIADSQGGKEPDLAKLAGDTKISGDTEVKLSLLNVRTVISFNDIRSFDLPREIEEANKSNSMSDLLTNLGTGTTPEPPTAETVSPAKKAITPAKKPNTRKIKP